MMKNLWDFISDVGCYSELDYQERRRLMLLNRLNFITFFVLVFYMIVELFMKVYVFMPFLVVMLLFVLVTFLLLYFRFYRTAKNFAVLVIAMCISFFTLNTGDALSEVLFIPLSVMPLIIFKDKRVSVFYLFFLVALSIALRLLQPHIEPLLRLSQDELFFFRVMNLINGIVITYFVTYYFKKANESFESKLLHMNEVISEKNKEITDSITYAKRLQEAILPSKSMIDINFPDSFILYKPKDIVAGDFYWMEPFAKASDSDDKEKQIVLFAAADCTGHGVPGAMVSVVCSNALNRAVKEFNITEPGKILDKVRKLVVETFEKSESEVKDGMDISLFSINSSKTELLWAGANNPLIIIRKKNIIEYKPDKQPIGKTDIIKSFVTHHIAIEKGDLIYTFTDGFADQFGGPKGKKYKYAQLKETLIKISEQSMREQHSLLEDTFNKWKGELEQVDDILLIGMRV